MWWNKTTAQLWDRWTCPISKNISLCHSFCIYSLFYKVYGEKSFLWVKYLQHRAGRLNFRWKIGQMTLEITSFVFYHEYTFPGEVKVYLFYSLFIRGLWKQEMFQLKVGPHHQVPVIAVPRHSFLPYSQQNLCYEPVYFLPCKTSQRQRHGLVVALAGLMAGLDDPCQSISTRDILRFPDLGGPFQPKRFHN